MAGMKKMFIRAAVLLFVVTMAGTAAAQKDKDDEPTSWLSFVIIKDDNGKPVRNAAVIMHPVAKGKQMHGGMELKTDAEGKTNYDGIPYGMLRVQVLAQGFQTYGQDFDIEQPKMDFTIKLKRPQGQYSVYDDHSKDAAKDAAKDPSAPPKQDAPPPEPDKKPN
jgi:hypothetical protein